MHESSTYQAIIEEGRTKGLIEGLQGTLLRLGRIRFGRPTKATTTALNGITDPDRLQRMTERLLTVTSWRELLETP